MGSRGRPNGSITKDIPQKVFDAIQIYVWGRDEGGKSVSWADVAVATGCHIRTLRKYREYSECQQFLRNERSKRADEKREGLNKAHEILLDAAPSIATRLTQIALSPKTKDYVAENACTDIFRIIQEGVSEVELRKKLDGIKEQIAAIERGGPIVDV